jgi:hypothetical protein
MCLLIAYADNWKGKWGKDCILTEERLYFEGRPYVVALKCHLSMGLHLLITDEQPLSARHSRSLQIWVLFLLSL